MNFKKDGFNIHQGDVQVFQLDGIPKGLKKIEKRFVAASERSGSFHALFGNYDMYDHPEKGGVVVDVKEEVILNHSLEAELLKMGVTMSSPDVLPKKDHRHSVIPKGVYFVAPQNRFDPLSATRQVVRD